jgi:hypothetical protein
MENALRSEVVRAQPAKPLEAGLRWIKHGIAWILFGPDPRQTVIDLGLAEDCRDEDA